MVVALVDACVLYPASLRDVFMWLAAEFACQLRWTDAIHEEWIRNVLEDRPDLTRDQLERTRQLMDSIDAEGLVSGYEARLPDLSLPDANDRHVLAAAIEANASVIVTMNLSDFPESVLKPHRVKALHPDEFLATLFEDEQELFLQAIRKHRSSLRRPPKTAEEYLETMRRNGLASTASHLERFRGDI